MLGILEDNNFSPLHFRSRRCRNRWGLIWSPGSWGLVSWRWGCPPVGPTKPSPFPRSRCRPPGWIWCRCRWARPRLRGLRSWESTEDFVGLPLVLAVPAVDRCLMNFPDSKPEKTYQSTLHLNFYWFFQPAPETIERDGDLIHVGFLCSSLRFLASSHSMKYNSRIWI